MTSTPFNIGLSDNTRSSSRVLRPPGGGHTDIFGGEPEPPRGRRAFPPQPPSQIGQGDQPTRPTNGSEPPASQNGNGNGNHAHAHAHAPTQDTVKEAPQPKSESPRAENIECVKVVSEINDNKIADVKVESANVADAKVESAKVEPAKFNDAKVEPPKRVRVPPGGFSSGLW